MFTGMLKKRSESKVVIPKIGVGNILDKSLSLIFNQFPILLLFSLLMAFFYLIHAAYEIITGKLGVMPASYFTGMDLLGRVISMILAGMMVFACSSSVTGSRIS